MQKHFLFVSSFEHVNFTINEKYSQKLYDNPNYYASLVIFQTYKNVVSIHLGGSFDCVFTYKKLKLTLKLQEGLNSRSKIEIRNDVMWD
jgi:hypothetical protein